eukprot:RCo045742
MMMMSSGRLLLLPVLCRVMRGAGSTIRRAGARSRSSSGGSKDTSALRGQIADLEARLREKEGAVSLLSQLLRLDPGKVSDLRLDALEKVSPRVRNKLLDVVVDTEKLREVLDVEAQEKLQGFDPKLLKVLLDFFQNSLKKLLELHRDEVPDGFEDAVTHGPGHIHGPSGSVEPGGAAFLELFKNTGMGAVHHSGSGEGPQIGVAAQRASRCSDAPRETRKPEKAGGSLAAESGSSGGFSRDPLRAHRGDVQADAAAKRSSMDVGRGAGPRIMGPTTTPHVGD